MRPAGRYPLSQMSDQSTTIEDFRGPRGQYVSRDIDNRERNMALAIYAETLSIATAARETGIPESTINYWINSEEGTETVEDLRIAARANSAHKFMAITAMAQDAVLKRLAQGDPHVTKRGEIVYAPVKAKDAAVIASIATDKTYLIAGAMADGQKINRALRSIADQLTQAIATGVSAELDRRHIPPPPDDLAGELG